MYCIVYIHILYLHYNNTYTNRVINFIEYEKNDNGKS
jgi:hypothetical protein